MISYLDKYDVLKNFKTNDYQEVLIASDKENPDKVVVINIINKQATSSFLSKSQIPTGLNNLIHLEEKEDAIIVVTDYLEGTSFSTYISYLENTLKHKTSLAFEYLNKIVCYDAFSNGIKKILIGETQVTFKDNYIFFNELLLIESEPESIEHSVINNEIASILEKILFSGRLTDVSENTTAFIQRLRAFLNRLRTSDSFKCINDICEAFRKVYLYDMYIDDTPKDEDDKVQVTPPLVGAILSDDTTTNEITNETESAPDTSTIEEPKASTDKTEGLNNDFNHIFMDGDNNSKEIVLTGLSEHITPPKKKKQDYRKPIMIGCIIALVLVVSSLAITKLLPTLTTVLKPVDEEQAKLAAHFTITKKDDAGQYKFTNDSKLPKGAKFKKVVWNIYQDNEKIHTIEKFEATMKFTTEGEYKIELIITDTNDDTDTYTSTLNYSKKYDIDDLDATETTESLSNLDITYSDNVSKDSEAFRSGSYSLKLGKDGETTNESFVVNNISLEDNPVISFWIASSKTEPVDIFIQGLRNDKVLVSKKITHKPSKELVWDMVKYSSPNKDINRVRITFKNLSNSIWIDDIKIDYYK